MIFHVERSAGGFARNCGAEMRCRIAPQDTLKRCDAGNRQRREREESEKEKGGRS